MIIKVTNLTNNIISTDLGALSAFQSIQITYTPPEAYRIAQKLSTLESSGRVKVEFIEDDPSDLVTKIYHNFSDAYNGQVPLKLGDSTLWLDSLGRLRSKQGTPTTDTDGTVVGNALGSAVRLQGTTLQFTADSGTTWNNIVATNRFNVRDYGAKGDQNTDDHAAIQAAINACDLYIRDSGNTFGHKGGVWFPPGTYRYSKPIFVPPGVTIYCDSPYEATLVSMGYQGYDFIVGRPADDLTQTHGPFELGTVFNVPGRMTYAYPGHRDMNNFFYDVAQARSGRIPYNANWTLAWKFRFDAINQFAPIFSIGGTLWAAMPNGVLFQVMYPTSNTMRLDFRYNGQSFSRNINVAGQAPVTIGSEFHFEVAWDNAAGTIRVFINGVLWNDGAWVPTGGFGTVDNSGWCQKPWEGWYIGMGNGDALSEEITGENVKGSLSQLHLSRAVRHTANFTPSGTVTPDSSTQLLINFDQFYKGMLVGDCRNIEGFPSSDKVYFYPRIGEVWETPQVTIRNLFIYGGGGILGVFASAMTMDNVNQLGPSDGWRFLSNGYFSKWNNCSVSASAGRMAYYNAGGSYIRIDGCTMAGKMCWVFNGANIFGENNSNSMHPDNYIGLYYAGGGVFDWTGYSTDAEEATAANVPFIASVVTVDPAIFKLSTATLYNPTNKRTTDPILRCMNNQDTQTLIFDNCSFSFPPTAGVVLQNQTVSVPAVGKVNWAKPAIVTDPQYYSPLVQFTDNPRNVLITSDVRDFEQVRLGTAAPVSGTWKKGMVVRNSNPQPGGWKEWICTADGTPGTWKGVGLIEA